MMMKRKTILMILLLPALVCMGAGNGDTERLKAKVDKYVEQVERQPDWLYSRLQMYWTTHATDVFFDGEKFARPGGAKAPAPTVKFAGTRGTESAYDAPKTEDLVPYDDDATGAVTYISKLTGKMEKAHPSKTGSNIGSVNRRIVTIARDAARLYAATGDERYARTAFGVFDVYMKGIYYRNVPTDLNHGHGQTLVGMQTFEVIHEDIINELTEIYTLLNKYITRGRDVYDAAFKKWADNIISNGVPHNNWNLFQARFITKIALVLQPDAGYADKKGREYYLSCVTDRSSVRQWSMKKLADFGFDPETAIWYESPGYSVTVLNEFASFADELDQKAGIDLFKQLPVLRQAILTSPQYLFPNRMIAGFGDTHPTYLSTSAIESVLKYAKRHGDCALEAQFEALKKAVSPGAADGEVGRYVSPSFYAPNVSWLVQRTGMNPKHDLMVSLNGSLGNHQHANGISMELYGKGYVLGPDAGIGKYLYGGLDYAEYYSQFPAHNTVCVDGISSYPVMMSAHAFKVDERYPSTNDCTEFSPVTFSQVSFIEPETQSRQVRVNGIVKTSETGGYYVDIFRSRKIEGGDKTHDYFYHNLGQDMTLTRADGSALELHPTDELAFAGGHLYAYSYIYNKMCTEDAGDIKATFTVNQDIRMTMWMEGYPDRKIVQALSPENREYERMPGQPYDIEKQPVLTFVARQRGEAWTRPFVAVFEPSSNAEPSEIESVDYFKPESADSTAVGIVVTLKSGRRDYIFSSVDGAEMTYRGMTVSGRYAVVSDAFTLENGVYKKTKNK